MTMPRYSLTKDSPRFKLVGLESDEPELFADLLGLTGKFARNGGTYVFIPTGADALSVTPTRVNWKGDRVRVRTDCGNVFVFRKLAADRG